MKERRERIKFWLLLGVTALLCILSAVFSFGLAAAFYLVAAIMFLEYDNALKPKDIFPCNPRKTACRRRGTLEKFKKEMLIYYVISFSLATVLLIIGILK